MNSEQHPIIIEPVEGHNALRMVWLVIGQNRRAKMVSDLMNIFREKGNIFWFDTQEVALTFLDTF